MIENNTLSNKYVTDVDRLEAEVKKHIETIENLFTK
jgi:hypothetical protein